MADSSIPPRPPTPQALLHRLPDKLAERIRKPSKYIILIMGSTGAAGKVQIARSVAAALSCPLYQGDSIHDSSAKAASVGTSWQAPVVEAVRVEPTVAPNEARYRRMWLSKLTRTGLLFPEESRPATEGFSGFGGLSSSSASRRGSVGSVSSASSYRTSSLYSDTGSRSDTSHLTIPATSSFNPDGSTPGVATVSIMSEEERLRRENPALMVLTHPELERWHRTAIRTSVGDYGIGVLFVPLDEEEGEMVEDLPILRPLDPMTMSSFPISVDRNSIAAAGSGLHDEEIQILIEVNEDVESKTAQIIASVRDVMAPEKQSSAVI